MASPLLSPLTRHLHRLVGSHPAGEMSDAQLLRRFVSHRDEAAFARLLCRLGPLVWGVCRRMTPQEQDAEDAFQATFLALARRGGAIREGEAVAAWLYRAAYRIARRARQQATRRAYHERHAGRKDRAHADLAWRELQAVLDEEVQRLPRKYRDPFVSCCLDGRGRKEVAAELGWKEGTVSSRIAEARRRLQQRLAKRGVTLSAVLTAGELWRQSAHAAIPAALGRQAVAVALGKASAKPAVAALANAAVPRVVGGVVALLLGLTAVAALAAGYLASAPTVDGKGKPVAVEDRRAVDVLGDPLPPGAVARLGTVRFRPGSYIRLIQFTPDGKRLISYDTGNEVVVWDVATGQPIVRHRFGRLDQYGIAFLPRDGSTVVMPGWREWGKVYAMRRRALPDFRVLKEFDTEFRTGRDKVMGLSPDGNILAGVVQHHMEDYSVDFWDVTEGKKIRSWHAHPGEINCLAFSADGKTLATGGADKTVRTWDVATGAKRFESAKVPLVVGQVAVSDDGRTVAAVGTAEISHHKGQRTMFQDNHVHLWDVPSGKATHRLGMAAVPQPGWALTGFTALRFTADGKTLLTAGSDSRLRLWDVTTGKQLRQLRHDAVGWGACDFSPDGKTLAVGMSGDRRSAIHLIDVAAWKEVVKVVGPAHAINAPVLTPDARTAVTLGDGAVTLWDAKAGRERGRVGERGSLVKSAHLLPDGRTLLCQDEEKALRWVDLVTRKETRRADTAARELLAVSPDGKTAASTSADYKVLVLIDLGTGREVDRLPDDGAHYYYGAGFTPDGQTLLTWSAEHAADVWDLQTPKRLRQFTFAGPPPPPPDTPLEKIVRGDWRQGSYCAALSPTGRLLVYGNSCGYLAIHDVATGKAVQVVGNLSRHPYYFAFTPDGRMLAWADLYGSTVHLLEVASGKERLRLDGHAGTIRSLAFAADGRTLVSGSEDKSGLVWDVLGNGGSKGDLETCWADLADADAAKGFRAIRRLLRAPAEAVAFVGKRMRAVPGVEAKRVKALIADLDSEVYATREAAAAELARLGDATAEALREALAGTRTLEMRLRLERLLASLDAEDRAPSAERRRSSRCLEVLERIPTAEARNVLRALARGAPGAWLTREATETLARRRGR